MATKDNFPLLLQDKQNNVIDNGQYSNFALNKNHPFSSDAFFGRSKIVASERKKVLDYEEKPIRRTVASIKLSDLTNDSQTKNESRSWNKSTSDLSPFVVNNGFGKGDRSKKEKALSASTLSLHIKAYENSNEVNLCDGTKEGLIKKGLNAKQISFNSTTVIQNPFESARQQENGGAVNPEIAQYRASQQLLNPNQMHQANFQPNILGDHRSITTMEAITDLQLRLLRKFRAFPPQNLPSTEFGRKLVGISSRYGFAVIAGPENRLISVKTHDLQALQADDFKELEAFPKRELDFFSLQAEIFSVEFNSDGRVFAVAANTPNGAFVYVFDGFTFHPSYSQQPFPLQSIRLGSNNAAKLTSFEWNPCIPEIFATSTTDGLTTIQYTLNNPKSFAIIGNQTLKSVVTCISWSPKGKQLSVGDAEGSITQLKPELVPVRRVEAPPSFAGLGNPPYRCAGICWLSNTEWVVVHSSTTNYLNLSLLTAKKALPPTWEPWSGVLPPLSDSSLPKSVNFLPLFDWQFVLGTSTCLTNAITFGNNGTAWKPWELPEPFVINTPLSTNRTDTFIIGSGYDFTSSSPVIIERDGTQVPPQPIIYTLTSDGVLLLYHVTSLNPARPSMNKAIEPCDLNATKNGEQPMGYQPRANATNPSLSTPIPVKQQPTTSLFGTPSTTSLFSSFGKTEAPSTPTSTFQSTVSPQNTSAAVEEAERKRKEAELKAHAEEQERQKRLAAEEEQKRKAAAEAEAQRQRVEEEAKRKQQITMSEANFKANLDGLVSKLNEYSRVVDALRAFKTKLMQNVKLNVEFDAHLEPMLKSLGYVSIIGNDIEESLARLRQVSNSVQRSAKESQQFLHKDTKELPTPEWVLELSDNLDDLEQREFVVVEKLQQTETKMEKIAKLLKEGKAKAYQRNQLTPEQQQKLEKDSKTMLIFVRKLWERINLIRQQIKAVNANERLKKATQAIRSAGGEHNISLLNESNINLDTSDNNDSMLASELMASMSIVDDKKNTSEVSKNNIQNLLKHLDGASTRLPKLVNVVSIDKFVSTQQPKEISQDSTILKPKVAEAQKALIENLMKVQSPRAAVIQNVPAAPPRQPLSLFGNKPADAATVSQPTVSTPQQPKGIFGSGNMSFGTGTPTSAPSFGNISNAEQPKTSTPKPLFGAKANAFTSQQSASPLFGSPVTSASSPLTSTFKGDKTTTREAEEQKRAEEEQKRKDAAEAEAKKKAAEEEEAEKKKKEAEEKAKKEAEEQERLKKLAEEEEAKKKAAEAEEKKKAAELEAAQKQAAEEEAKKQQEAATVASAPVVTPSATAPISFSFKPVGSTPATAIPTTTSSAPINFSFKPQTVAKSDVTADIGMEDDGLDSALAGTNICSPTNTASAFGSTGSGFSSFGGSTFGQPQPSATPATQNNPFGGVFSSATTTKTNGSAFGGTSAFGSAVKNPFGGGGGNTGFSSFGGSGFTQQQPSLTTTSTPQKNPFGSTSAFGSPSTGSAFGSGTSAFAQATKSPFAAAATSATSGSGFSSFGNKPSAFGSNASPFASAASGSAFGGGSAFAQAIKSPFAAATSNTATSQTTGSAFGGGGFTSFGNKAGGFGALAQQATSNNPQNNTGFGSTSAFGGGSAFGSPRQ